jgi:DNA primase
LAFPKHFLDELRGRVNVVELVGRHVQLKKRGRDHWGCCPFHSEKSPSFKVSEDRDDYHCFGCGAHGSAFDFVMQTQGVSFPECVEQLADFAGMQVPEVTPEDRERADLSSRLSEANEAAAKWYQAQLNSGVGTEARDYVERRGLSDRAVEEFRIGYAPDRNDGLKSALLERGFSEAELIEAGLIAKPDDGRGTYDRFRNRLMFPISDRRGRVIAFGGRALGEARAKYLNSPETPLFSKSFTLYNFAMAREAAREAGTVIVAEGYMDVIALAEAGFRNAVAPLGTAVTEDQIGMLWQMAAEPVMCLDGDQAGLRAAQRAAERALPILKPGKSLRFAILPEGKDPDDLLRDEGPAALKSILNAARSMAAMLFQTAAAGRPIDTPERRAGLDAELTRIGFQIEDETIRRHYQDDFRNRARELFRGANQSQNQRPSQRGGDNRNRQPWRGRPMLEDTSALRATMGQDGTRTREETILAALIEWPDLVEDFDAQLDEVHFRNDDLDQALMLLRDAVMRHPGLDSEAISRHFHAAGLQNLIERLRAPTAVRLNFRSSKNMTLTEVGEQFGATLHRYRIEALEEEHREAAAISRRDLTQEALERQFALKQELDRLRASEPAAMMAARAGL